MKKLVSLCMVLSLLLTMVACNNESPEVEVIEGLAANSGEGTEIATEPEAGDVEEVVATETVNAPMFDNRYPDFILGEDESTVTYLDKFGNASTISKNPQKVVVLYNSLLGLWYYMGGTSLTKVKGSSNVPEEAMDLDDLGSSSSVSLEAIIAYEPDLVVISGNIDGQVAMVASLNEMGIEAMIVDAKTNPYERFTENAYLFSKVLGTEDLYEEKTEQIIEAVNDMMTKASEATSAPRVAPIFATSKSMTLETDIAQIGEIVGLLGGEMIYNEDDLMAEGETRLPFSIEALVAQNPEVILISTMGSVASAQTTINGMIEENPVWHEVDAVINNRVFYLDKELSVYKPNQRYGEAFELIASYMYPELFEMTESAE